MPIEGDACQRSRPVRVTLDTRQGSEPASRSGIPGRLLISGGSVEDGAAAGEVANQPFD